MPILCNLKSNTFKNLVRYVFNEKENLLKLSRFKTWTICLEVHCSMLRNQRKSQHKQIDRKKWRRICSDLLTIDLLTSSLLRTPQEPLLHSILMTSPQFLIHWMPNLQRSSSKCWDRIWFFQRYQMYSALFKKYWEVKEELSLKILIFK